MVERPEEGPDQGTYREWDAEYARRSLIWSKRFISALIEGRRKGKISKKKEAEARKEASKLVRKQRRYNKWSRKTLYCDESLDEGTDVEMNEEDPEENPVMTLTVSEETSEPATEATPTTTTPPILSDDEMGNFTMTWLSSVDVGAPNHYDLAMQAPPGPEWPGEVNLACTRSVCIGASDVDPKVPPRSMRPNICISA